MRDIYFGKIHARLVPTPQLLWTKDGLQQGQDDIHLSSVSSLKEVISGSG